VERITVSVCAAVAHSRVDSFVSSYDGPADPVVRNGMVPTLSCLSGDSSPDLPVFRAAAPSERLTAGGSRPAGRKKNL
jgi:hypothetical protein